MKVQNFTGELYRATMDRRNLHLPEYPANDNDEEIISELDEAKSNFEFVWSGKIKSKSRYSTGNWSVLYTTEDASTAIAECVYHLYDKHSPDSDFGELIDFRLVQYKLEFSGKVHKLDEPEYDLKKLVAPKYEHCHVVAKKAREKVCALVAPSARQLRSKCFPIFNNNSVSNLPEAWSVLVEVVNGEKMLSVLAQGKQFQVEIHDVYQELKNAS